jgi:microcin C transport system permease protein
MAMSELTRRRWAIFRSDRRGFWSAVVLGAVVFVSLFAELLCNNRPLMVTYNNELYFPIFKTYAETTFGGIFETEADYQDPAIREVLETPPNSIVWPPVRFDYQYVDTSLSTPAPSPPDREHWLGTDDRSRDVLARLVYGFRLSILFGAALAVFGSVLGILIGAVQGFVGGKFDLVCQRVIEIWSSQNELYLLIILSSLLEPSIGLIFGLLSLFGWMGLSAYVRAEFLRARQLDYVQSAVALGSSRRRVMWSHILPNTLTPVITFFPFRVSEGIMGLTALDFLALGVPPPTASLGELLSQGKANIASAWWIIVSVFFVITMTIMMLNFIGEAVHRAMDPNQV